MTETIHTSVRQLILDRLKLEGDLTVARLAEQLEVTLSAVRQQLSLLEADGLVEYTDEKGRRGRPLRHYRLSREGDEQFTRTYAGLAESLLASVQAKLGPDALDAAFDGRREQMEAELRPHIRATDLSAKVREFAEAMATRGYMPTVATDERGHTFTWHNCPVARIARQYSQPCSQEIRLIESLLGAPVVRETCMAKGEIACRYRVLSPPSDTPRPIPPDDNEAE